MNERLALYTTIYPGAAKFLPEWCDSLLAQTDRDVDVWIGADQMDPGAVIRTIGNQFNIQPVIAAEYSTPAMIRQNAIGAILASEKAYSGVIFVDSDDLLGPGRVEAARAALQISDVSGCAMEIVNENGTPTGLFFRPASEEIPECLARVNVFGFSNSAYRTDILRLLPPAPVQCRLMDWFMATAAWTRSARFSFDGESRMLYRQYSTNTARVLLPFTPEEIRRATTLVLDHYEFVSQFIPDIPQTIRAAVEDAHVRVALFEATTVADPTRLERYVTDINQLSPSQAWWDWVAHPLLECQWKS